MLSTPVYLGVMAAGFFSGLVDSIAGGGGLISVPALLAAGMPTATALGTNKVAASFGSSTASVRYGLAGHVQRVAWPMAALAFAASLTGASMALKLPDEALRRIVMAALILVAAFTIFRKDFGGAAKEWPHSRARYAASAASFAVMIGFYDGLVGPGTGTFLAFSFVVFLGADLISATANTKVINFATNIAAAILFAIGRHVDWIIALPMGVCILAGAYVGSGTALKVGPKLIRPVFLVVVGLLLVKIWMKK